MTVRELRHVWKQKLNIKCKESIIYHLSPTQYKYLSGALGSEFSLPDFQQGFVNINALPINQELEVRNLRTVKLFLQRLSHSHVVVTVCQKHE